MATPGNAPSMGRMVVVGIVIAALVGAGTGFLGGWLARPAATPGPTPQAREFYLFSWVVPYDEGVVGQPPDAFTPGQLVVNVGDNVTIHFYNTEDPVTQEDHSFTMAAPYAIDRVVGAGNSTDIVFTAQTAGVFRFWCKFHLPSMVGQLVVLG